LQGLLLYPRNPVAIINGQTVSVGSHVSDARVVSIDLHSVTIVTAAGRTNVLEMAEQ
jgi:peroxiredoxin